MEGGQKQVQAALALLIQNLESKQADGSRAVWLTPRGRKDLKALPGLAWTSEAGPVDSEKVDEPMPLERGASVQFAVPEAKVSTSRVREDPPLADLAEISLVPEGESREEKLAWLRRKAAEWAPARKLGSLRDTMVFAVGNPESSLMLVGEAPGAEEERQGEPFVGPAGETLTKILRAMGLKREDVYITNIVKFRPGMENQGESNRPPTPEEMASCIAFVRAEIAIVQPKVIVALGGTASKGLLGGDESVARMRGRFFELAGVPVIVTYHPAYLLRNTSISEKRKVWEDMLLVMERLNLPISEKQRGFFK